MSEDTTIIMIHSFLHSNLDYRNSLFNNLPKYLINKLQKILNTATRIIKHKNKFDHITPVLKDLHWLPIERKSIFKIAVLTYKTLNGDAPQYLNDIIHKHTSVRTLRSTNRNLLKILHLKTSTFGTRAFSYSAPYIWCNLPESVKNAETLQTFTRKAFSF